MGALLVIPLLTKRKRSRLGRNHFIEITIESDTEKKKQSSPEK